MPMFGFPFRLVSSAEVKVAGAGRLASRPPAAVLGDGQAPAERVATVCPSLRETKVSAPLPGTWQGGRRGCPPAPLPGGGGAPPPRRLLPLFPSPLTRPPEHPEVPPLTSATARASFRSLGHLLGY